MEGEKEMEEKKQIKISLGAVISVFIIILLTVALVGMYCYYNFVVIPKYEVANNETENVVESNKNNENNVEENLSQEEVVSPYEKYEDYEELFWRFKDSELEMKEVSISDKKIKIEEGKAYLYSGDSAKEVIDIEGKAKYVITWGENKAVTESVYILTEEGTIWESECVPSYDFYENKLKDNKFTKINFADKVIDITSGENILTRIFEGPYFLLDNGDLINKNGSYYEELDGGFVKVLCGSSYNGADRLSIFIKEDNTMYTYNSETRKYVQIKDENNKDLIFRDGFVQWSSTYNNLTPGIERVFVVTQDNKLFYFDGFSNVVAKEYKETAGKTIKNAIEEKQADEYGGHRTNARITFTDGTEMILNDVWEK